MAVDDGLHSMAYYPATVDTSPDHARRFSATCGPNDSQLLAEIDEEGLGVPLRWWSVLFEDARRPRSAITGLVHLASYLRNGRSNQSSFFSLFTVAELFPQFSNMLYLESADLT
jgi:hypothetical protein